MGKNEAIAKLEQYKRLLSKHLDIQQVILFGSYATGVPGEDSDIDVAIVVDQIQGDYFSVTPLLWKLRRQVDERIEPLLFESGNDASGFLSEITKHGIVIQ
jgi:predicted nucleotidyltransferase